FPGRRNRIGSEDGLTLLYEQRSGAQIIGALGAIEKVLLKLLAQFRGEFIQQILLGPLDPDCLVVVHIANPYARVVTRERKTFHSLPLRAEAPASSFKN